MQKIATKVFIFSSISFGMIGIIMVLVGGPDGNNYILLNQMLRQILLMDVCIILPSFALSIAGKYLNNDF